MPTYTVWYHKIGKPNMRGSKAMSGKDIDDVRRIFAKSSHAKTDEIFEIKVGAKVIWSA